MWFKKKPVVVEARQFTGGNFREMNQFIGKSYLHEGDLHWGFLPVEEGEDEVVATVWDKLHSTWVGVKASQWIIKGVKGEFYPCDADVFEETYTEVTDIDVEDAREDKNSVSPYCMRCAPKHRGIPHYHHETSEHDDWLERYAKKLLAGNFIDIGPECFADPEGNVISWKGENFYKACDAWVCKNDEGGQSFCVKRVGHDGSVHESYDGEIRVGIDA